MNRIFPWALAALFCLAANLISAAEMIPLAGEWRFALDRNDVGTNEKWFAKNLPDKIQLPGILQAQGYGDDISTNTPWVLTLGDAWWNLQPEKLREHFSQPGHVEVPFLAQPPKHYLGAAWYQRDIEIPKNWSGKHLTLFLERVHWKSTVWLDDKEISSDISLSTPHECDLGIVGQASSLSSPTNKETGETPVPLQTITPGKHRLTIRVDNRTQLPIAGHLLDSHSISDALGAAWNGIVGKIELRATPPVWIDDVQVFPNVTNKSALVKMVLRNETGRTIWASIGLDASKLVPQKIGGTAVKIGHGKMFSRISLNGSELFQSETPISEGSTVFPTLSSNRTEVEVQISFDTNAIAWDEFHPLVCKIYAELNLMGSKDEFAVNFGLREITAHDKDILLNGNPINLRLTHFGGDFPLTGYPAMDVASWKKIFQTCKDYGLNGMRFHSWCPPEAAFAAADELGFYLAPECPLWADFGNEPTREFLTNETARILKNYGNHPSFILLSPSNEPRNYSRFTPEWAATNYANDPRRLYSAATGWSDPSQVAVGGAQFATLVRYDGTNLRGPSGWFGNDFRGALENVHIPILAHEVGQWCAYPDFDVINKFAGCYLQPGNYDIFQYIAQQNGVLDEDKKFAQASGKFQLECYKEEIEANLRTPGLAGFELLDLHDYLGQGTALIGVLDAFWESKGYASAEDFRKFCGSVVPLARLSKRIFTAADKFEVPVEIYNFGDSALTNTPVNWEIVDVNNFIVTNGLFSLQTIPVGKNFPLGKISLELLKFSAPQQYKLQLKVADSFSSPARFANDWNFWVYPAQVEDSKSSDILVTRDWNAAETNLAAGKKVLFLPANENLDSTKCPPMKNVPIFWNIQMTVRPPRNPRPRFDAFLGLFCETNSPALAKFPTDANCDWQWTPLINNVRAINLTSAPRDLKPIVWCIDDWNRNWKLGVLFECRVGAGKLFVSAINLNAENADSELKQLRRSILDYMSSDKFEPTTTLSLEQMGDIFSTGKNAPSEPARVFDPDLNDGSISPSSRQ